MTQSKPEFEIGDQVLSGMRQVKATVLDRKHINGAGWFYKTSDKPDKWRNGILLDPVKPDSV